MVEVAGTEELATTLERSETSNRGGTRYVSTTKAGNKKKPIEGGFLVEVAGFESAI